MAFLKLSKYFEEYFEENETLIKEKETLSRENETLTRENETLSREKETLSRENETLSREKETLSREKETLIKEKEILTRENDIFKIQEQENIKEQIMLKLSRHLKYNRNSLILDVIYKKYTEISNLDIKTIVDKALFVYSCSHLYYDQYIDELVRYKKTNKINKINSGCNLWIGIIYYFIKNNIENAIKYLSLSCDKKEANCILGLIYYKKSLSMLNKTDIENSIKYYKLSSEQGVKEANFLLGSIYNFIRDSKKAIHYFQLALEQGVKEEYYILEVLLKNKNLKRKCDNLEISDVSDVNDIKKLKF